MSPGQRFVPHEKRNNIHRARLLGLQMFADAVELVHGLQVGAEALQLRVQAVQLRAVLPLAMSVGLGWGEGGMGGGGGEWGRGEGGGLVDLVGLQKAGCWSNRELGEGGWLVESSGAKKASCFGLRGRCGWTCNVLGFHMRSPWEPSSMSISYTDWDPGFIPPPPPGWGCRSGENPFRLMDAFFPQGALPPLTNSVRCQCMLLFS